MPKSTIVLLAVASLTAAALPAVAQYTYNDNPGNSPQQNAPYQQQYPAQPQQQPQYQQQYPAQPGYDNSQAYPQQSYGDPQAYQGQQQPQYQPQPQYQGQQSYQGYDPNAAPQAVPVPTDSGMYVPPCAAAPCVAAVPYPYPYATGYYGYPVGVGVGIGIGYPGYYRGGYVYHGYVGGPRYGYVGGIRGGYVGGVRGGYAAGVRGGYVRAGGYGHGGGRR